MMASSQIRFDLFPAEIIQRIAAFSSCESVLALLKVNRQLYKTCNDPLVFRSIIKNGSGHGILQPWNCDLISQSTSTSTLARLALADSRAREWLAAIEERLEEAALKSKLILEDGRILDVEEMPENAQPREEDSSEDDMSHLTPESMMKWAPQLVTLHHPFIMEGHSIQLAAQFQATLVLMSDYSQDLDAAMPMSFCVAATTLYICSEVILKGGSTAKLNIHERFAKIMTTRSVRHSSQIEIILAFALMGTRRVFFTRFPPPSPYNIPFQSIFDIPIPFSGKFSRGSHLPVMTSVPFLENGEWVGNYSYSLNLSRPRFDPPMEKIKFTADPDLGSYGLHASGFDRVGSFTLTGSVDDSGVVEMTKTYAQGFAWNWNASMTPFGIVGTWGRGNTPHGHFWLWKKEWSQGQRVSDHIGD